jgi:SNF2 family DNA or RNA helicase
MQLLPHQKTALEFINSRLDKGVGVLHGDPAGSGKTLPALLACARAKTPGSIILWITLATIKEQLVVDGINKFNIPLRPFTLTGTKTKRLNDLYAIKNQPSDVDIIILNYEQCLPEEEIKILAGMDISIICCDESVRMGNIKNKTYKQILKLANYKKCKRLCLSGDVISNNPLEAFALFSYLNPGCLGNYWTFVSTYFVPSMWAKAGFVRTSKLPELAARLQPYYLRREREVLLPDLPDLLEQVLPVTLNAKEDKLFNQIRSSLLLEIKPEDINKIVTPHTMDGGAVKYLRLRQLCVTPQLLGEQVESSKLNALKEFISTIGTSKALIFTEFAAAIPFIQEVLPVGSFVVIQGSVDQIKRQAILKEFMENPAIRFLVGTSAMQEGINAQAGDFVIHLDPPMTWSAYDQRCSRAHRHGRTDKVVSVRMVSKIEPKLYKLIENKQLISLSAMPYSVMKEILC